MRIQCGVPGIATIAMWAAQAPKKAATIDEYTYYVVRRAR